MIPYNQLSIMSEGDLMLEGGPGRLFQNLQRLFDPLITTPDSIRDINDVIANLYLVIMGARRGYLYDVDYNKFLNNSEILRRLKEIIEAYNLRVTKFPDTNLYLVTREPINLTRLQHDQDRYLAELLNFGCYDPSFGDFRQPRIAYDFFLATPNDEYPIMTFVCTESTNPSLQKLQDIYIQFLGAIRMANPLWNIRVDRRVIPPMRSTRDRFIPPPTEDITTLLQ